MSAPPHTDRAPEGAPPTAPETRSTSRRPAHVGTPLTGAVPNRELHRRAQRERRLAAVPKPIRYTPHTGRAPQGGPPMAPEGSHGVPPAYFGTPLTRIVPRKEPHLWHQWATSHGFPMLIKAHASRRSRSTGSSTYGAVGVLPRGAPRSRGSRPKRSSARRCALLRRSPLSALPRGAQYVKRWPRSALHAAAQGCALLEASAGPLGGLSGGLSGACGGLLAASWRRPGGSWGAWWEPSTPR